jgi:DNA-binding NtrC family response regulator
MRNPLKILVVSSNIERRQDVAGVLSRLGTEPIGVSSAEECRHVLQMEKIQLVFADRRVNGGDYRDVLKAVASSSPGQRPKVVMMAELESREEYQQAKHDGVFDVISYPWRTTDIEWMVILAKREAIDRPQPAHETVHRALHRTARTGG